ncbi:acyl-coenzyme A synthetase [Phlyctema vagabunda]|uniref:Acyl-coenzyme A synthetase n=1 Tax=Phlyctema vagabunda TaxID=108571 RepID=A0ABR4PR68_9HELO
MTVYHAAENYELPQVDLLTLLFDSPDCRSAEDTVVHIEAANPSNGITKSQARDLTRKTAYGLRHRFGIGASGPGKDVVVCISSGQPLLPIVFYGVIAAGGVYSAASSAFTASELVRQVTQGRSNLIFCSPDVKDVAMQAARDCGIALNRVVVVDSDPWSMKVIDGGQEIMSEEMLEWERVTNQKELEESLVLLLYSSGTTGPPKGKGS